MSEWTVITVLVVMVGLVAAIVKPIVNLNSAITTNTVVLGQHTEALRELNANNCAEHKEYERQLNDHEQRIYILEDHTTKGA